MGSARRGGARRRRSAEPRRRSIRMLGCRITTDPGRRRLHARSALVDRRAYTAWSTQGDPRRVISHHAGDALCSDESGDVVTAFDDLDGQGANRFRPVDQRADVGAVGPDDADGVEQFPQLSQGAGPAPSRSWSARAGEHDQQQAKQSTMTSLLRPATFFSASKPGGTADNFGGADRLRVDDRRGRIGFASPARRQQSVYGCQVFSTRSSPWRRGVRSSGARVNRSKIRPSSSATMMRAS